MIDLTPWQVDFIRKAIHTAKMLKGQRSYTNKDDVELDNFADEFNTAYPDEGIDN